MSFVRSFATIGLRRRQELGIKVRQPLLSFTIKHDGEAPPFWDDVSELLKDELNVKEIVFKNAAGTEDLAYEFDTTLTPELIAEGAQRALDRAIAEARKSLNLSPQDTAHHEFAEDGAFSVELPDGTKQFNLIIDAT
jgi:hypothetical protein